MGERWCGEKEPRDVEDAGKRGERIASRKRVREGNEEMEVAIAENMQGEYEMIG